MNTHCNYVIAFADGSVKVGVTSRPGARMEEIRRKKRGVAPTACMLTPMSSKDAAFKTERDLCRLLRREALGGTREWFQGAGEYGYLKGVIGMFWHMNNRAPYEAIEVAV